MISVGIKGAMARGLEDFFDGPLHLSRPLCCFLFLLMLSVATTTATATGISYGKVVGAILT